MDLVESVRQWIQMLFDSHVLTVPWTADYFSAIVGVITGALFAVGRKLDIIGTVSLGLVAAFSGGIIRDMLLQDKGMYFMSCPDLILLCILAAVFVFYFQGVFHHLSATVFLCDALSVGLFALAGASKCVSCGVGFVLCVILGAITAVGGGAVRDICVGETPSLFKQTSYYGVAGLASSAVYVSLAWVNFPLPAAGLLCVATAVLLRYLSVYFDWKTSQPKDLTPKVIHGVKKATHEVVRASNLAADVARGIGQIFLHGGDIEKVVADERNERSHHKHGRRRHGHRRHAAAKAHVKPRARTASDARQPAAGHAVDGSDVSDRSDGSGGSGSSGGSHGSGSSGSSDTPAKASGKGGCAAAPASKKGLAPALVAGGKAGKTAGKGAREA